MEKISRRSEWMDWKEFYNEILSKPIYWFCMVFVLILAFLFDLMNRTVGIDDLSRTYYIGDGNEMLAGTRWGKTLWIRLLSNCEYAPFIDKYLTIFFLIVSAVLFSKLLCIYLCNNEHILLICILFSCSFVTFPLLNEVWVYNDSNVVAAGNEVLVAVSVLLLFRSKKFFSRESIVSSFLLAVVVSSYESAGFLYISVVLSVILLDYIFRDRKNWIINGIRYAVPLGIALILRYVIGFGLIYMFHLEYQPNGATEIQWKFSENLGSQIITLLSDTLNYYFGRGLIYYPITVFVVTFVMGTVWTMGHVFKKKDFMILILFILLCLSLFLQSFIQGTVMPYRTAQTIQYFSTFSLAVFIFGISMTRKRRLFSVMVVLSSFMIYRQAVFLNRCLALNNQRSEIESSAARQIGYRLKSMYDEKPVIFVGWFDFGENINRQIRPDYSTPWGFLYRKIAIHLGWNYTLSKVYDTNISSVLVWNTGAFHSQKMMAEYFSYFGYDISVRDNDDIYEYKQIAIREGMKPLDILDIGDYILVYLG